MSEEQKSKEDIIIGALKYIIRHRDTDPFLAPIILDNCIDVAKKALEDVGEIE